jgi:hypothetical protein
MIQEFSAIAEHHGVDGPCAPLSVLPMSRRRRAPAAPAAGPRRACPSFATGRRRSEGGGLRTGAVPRAQRRFRRALPPWLEDRRPIALSHEPAVADAPQGATPLGDDWHLVSLCQGISDTLTARSGTGPALSSVKAIEEECFSPLLGVSNAVWRKLYRAPQRAPCRHACGEDHLRLRERVRGGAPAGRCGCGRLLRAVHGARVIAQYEEVRTSTARLRKACSHMLVHHTAGQTGAPSPS